MRLPRGLHDTAAAFDGQVFWLFGGLTPSMTFSNEVVRFDPQTETVATTSYVLPSARQASAAVAFGGAIYVFGGTGTTGYLDQILRFEPGTGQFTTMVSRLPSGRYNLAAVASGQRIYLFGGFDGSTPAPVLAFDPATDTLNASFSTLPGGRHSPIGALGSGYVDIFGGSLISSFPAEVRRFDLASGSSQVLSVVSFPYPIFQPAPMQIDGKMYVYAGTNGGTPSLTIYAYDPSTAVVSQTVWVPPQATLGRGAASMPGRGYVFGGYSGGAVLDTIVRFVP